MIDEEHYVKLQMFLTDPKSQRMRYGAVQSILNALLDKFMVKLLDPNTDTIQMLKAYGVEFDDEEKQEESKETQE